MTNTGHNVPSMNGEISTSDLGVIQELYEDIPLYYDVHSTRSLPGRRHSYRNAYGIMPVQESVSALKRAGSWPGQSSTSISSTTMVPMFNQPGFGGPKTKIRSSSNRYRNIRQRHKLNDIENEASSAPSALLNTLDSLSDDELPDGLIVYDVPFSKPLNALRDHRAAYKVSHLVPYQQRARERSRVRIAQDNNHQNSTLRKPQSSGFGVLRRPHSGLSTSSSHSACSSKSSPVTRASSIFSIGSDMSEMSFFDDESSCLSLGGKMLNNNQDPHLDEAMQRISLLKSMSHLSLASTLSQDQKSDTSSKETVLPSKEKLHCLSVTRQTNLPPKDYEETVKHQQDYEHLVHSEIRKEREKIKSYQRQQQELKEREEYDCKLWRIVCKKYDALVCLPTTRELWWRGIPSKSGFRSSIWRRQLVGKKLKVNVTECLSQVHAIIDKACDYKTIVGNLGRKKFEAVNANLMPEIKRVEVYSKQIQRCFPDLLMFQLGTTFESVLSLALAFDIVKSKSECQEQLGQINTTRILRLICLLFKNLESEELAFHSLIDVLLKRLPHALLCCDTIPRTLDEQLKFESNHPEQASYLKDIKDQFDRFLLNTSPNVYNHFVKHNVNTLIILQTTVGTLFTNLLDIKVLERIFDIYIFEGDTFLLRCLLALIKEISYKLFGSTEEIYQYLGPDSLDVLNGNLGRKELLSGYAYLNVGEPEDFIREVRSILRKHNVR